MEPIKPEARLEKLVMRATRSLTSSLRLFGWCFVLFLISTQSWGQEAGSSYGTVSVSRVIRVIDGDTFVVGIDELPDLIGKDISVRVNGIDTPELRGGMREKRTSQLRQKSELRPY